MKFPRLSAADPLSRQLGACLILGGSNIEHVIDLVSYIAASAKSIDIILTKEKAEGFLAPASIDTRLLVCGGDGDISLVGLDITSLSHEYDNIFFVINDRYGIGYGNFIDIKDSLFPHAASYFYNSSREIFHDDPSHREFIKSSQISFDRTDILFAEIGKPTDCINILIDASYVTSTGRTGIGNYTFRMLKELSRASGIRIFALCQDKSVMNQTCIDCIFFGSTLGSAESKVRLMQIIEVFSIDVFISPYRAIPEGLRCKTILVVHDLIPLLFPDYFETSATYKYFDTCIRSTCKFVDFVVTVSRSTSRDVTELLGVPSTRIRTVYPGPGANLSCNPSSPPGLPPQGSTTFILYNGTIEPRKGILSLVSAYRMLRREFLRLGRSPPYLVLSGKYGWRCDAEKKVIKEMALDGVLHLGYVKDEELVYLYKAASLFVYPSTYEGFGLPILEAFSFGLPVVTFRNSALSEVGGDVAYFAKSQDAYGLYEALLFLSQSPIELERLRHEGFKRARQFSWERFQKEFCCILGELFPSSKIG